MEESREVRRRLISLLVALCLAGLFGQRVVVAQPTPLPQVSHPHETRMSIKARQLQQKLADDITQAKAKGIEVGEAEKHKSQGDAALSAGHLRIAVHEYEAGEKTLPGK